MNPHQKLEDLTDEQLTERVAVEVMHWNPQQSSDGWDSGKKPHTWFDPVLMIQRPMYKWNPLTDWNHTMEVRDRLRSLGWWMELENECCIGCEGCILHHDPGEDEPRKENISVRHEEDLRRAILLAALQAVRK